MISCVIFVRSTRRRRDSDNGFFFWSHGFFLFFCPQRATLAEKEVTALKEKLTNNKAQDTNVMTMATPLSNHVESTEDQNKTPAELELSAKEKEVRIPI